MVPPVDAPGIAGASDVEFVSIVHGRPAKSSISNRNRSQFRVSLFRHETVGYHCEPHQHHRAGDESGPGQE
jgi:hypothetical protein